MTKERVTHACNYINTISPGKGTQVKTRADKLEAGLAKWGWPIDLNEWLTFEIGFAEKTKALKSSAMSLVGKQRDPTAKSKGWRNAARAYVLLEILLSYRPLADRASTDNLLALARQTANANTSETTLQGMIQTQLGKLDSRKYRSYNDRASSGQATILKKAADVKGQDTGQAYMLTPKGKWWNQPMGYEPKLINFKGSAVQGIYTCDASGGCIPVAFLYSGKDDAELGAVGLVHIDGGNYEGVQWSNMAGGRDPSSIVVFISTKNNSTDNDVERYREWLGDILNYPEDRILFQLCSSGVNHGVDRQGRFGTVPNNIATSVVVGQEQDFPAQAAHQLVGVVSGSEEELQE
jgi:hypothetical protein